MRPTRMSIFAKSSQVISGISQSPRPTAREQIVLRRLYTAHPTDVGASRHGLRAMTGAAVTSLTHRRCLDRASHRCTLPASMRTEVQDRHTGCNAAEVNEDKPCARGRKRRQRPRSWQPYWRVGSLADNQGYHWQARVVDDTAHSAWLAYGGNAENAADVRVALPVATNHLEFTQQPTTTTAGATMAPVKVTLKDGQGNTITSFTGNVHLEIAPNANPGGDALARDLNAVAGVARFSDVTLTKAGSGYRLEATADGVAPVTSGSFGVNPGRWHYSKFLVQPSNAPPNRPIAPAVQVAVLDDWGNVATSYPYILYVQIAKDGSPGRNATLDQSGNGRAATAGIATFDNLKIDQLGVGYTFVVGGTEAAAATSGSFDVLVSLPAPP